MDNLNYIRQGVLAHCESLRVSDEGLNGRYRYAPGCQPTYWASAFVALTRYLFGDLENLSDEQRQQWLDYLIRGQDEQTGLWIDPVFKSKERFSSRHNEELLFWHSTTFILTAIELLGGMHRYPIYIVHPLRNPQQMVDFIEKLPWDRSPWIVGNWVYDVGCLLGHDYRITKEQRNLEGMEALFIWHEQHQLPDTGWWDLTRNHSVAHQQYGGYHTLMVYWMYNRRVPNPEAMITSSLSIQQPKGYFGKGCCEDMDVIDAVVTLSRQYNLKKVEVTEAISQVLPWLLAMQVKGSGFKDYPRRSRSEYGWLQCAAGPNEPDPCSDFFRGYSVALCGEMLPNHPVNNIPWRHHGTYCHGVRPRILLEG